MRMREEGFWLKSRTTIQCGDVAITIVCDVSKAVRSFELAATAAGAAAKVVADFARLHLDVELDPWQQRVLEALYVDPDTMAQAADPSAFRRLRPHQVLIDEAGLYFASLTPELSSEAVLAVRAAWEAERAPKLPERIRLAYREWVDDPEPDHVWSVADWPFLLNDLDEGPRAMSSREYLGIWPTPRERE